ncbi:DUF4390 domain-containing protein [Methylobacter sp. YRD-M1]|uniref:DUF4390 domain-containing protein n=1 Tax=Methylobacter sp. YRD-M1 TaxID=2911520 RepID=UPI00227B5B99|nr:DUF4390 domain-containing protein [Methylobacter sp. YRD-M1]WAK01672.1 DUF4390 domain-containing protein [Methylobacter sp. YRD-M1]
MPASLNDKFRLLICLFYLLLWPVSVHADEFSASIKKAELTLWEKSYVLSADIDYQLGDRAKDALQNGIPLFWTVLVKVQQHRDYLWNKKLLDKEIRYRIQYHALLNMYRVRNESSDTVDNFSTLSSALNAMSTIRNIPIMDKADIASDTDYRVGVKVRFERDALPLPLRPVAYINPQWYLSSDWYLWSLKK